MLISPDGHELAQVAEFHFDASQGTESRLRLIITTLANLVGGASHDPEVRLAHIREERRRIDEEIGPWPAMASLPATRRRRSESDSRPR
jgi:hypothetical protein